MNRESVTFAFGERDVPDVGTRSVAPFDGDPWRGAAEDAPARTRTLLVRTAGWLRLLELLPFPLAMVLDARYAFSHSAPVVAAYAVQAGWSLFFAAWALVKATLPAWMVSIDVVVASACLVVTGRSADPTYRPYVADPAVAMAMGSAVTAAVAWWRRRAIAVGVLLALSYLYGCLPAIGAHRLPLVSLVCNVLFLVGFTVISGTISSLLVRQTEVVRATTATMLVERERAAAQRARYDERMRQYRMLHDTVLSTLNAIALGGNRHDALLRQRCAAEAALIRSMISGGTARVSSLAGELAIVVRDQAAIGMRLHTNLAEVPGDIPGVVVVALSGACREALNNVAKHAGTNEAWVTCHPDDGGVVLTVVDRGCGFSPDLLTPGFGMTRSILRRMREVGGSSLVDSNPGEGTCVELRWPKRSG